MRSADRVEVFDLWTGRGRSRSDRYVFWREGVQAKDGAAVPASILDAFLAILAEAPLVAGPYDPRYGHTDDYPWFFMAIGTTRDDVVVFFSESQGPGGAPWAIQIEGTQYVVPSDAPARAFDLLRPYFPQARMASERQATVRSGEARKSAWK